MRIVSFMWGDPSGYIEPVHAAGGVVMHTVGSAGEARRAVASGVDVVVAQGWEAGGHVWGTVATLPLVPAVVDAVAPVPVIAAGGIGDARGVAAVLALGAQAAWLGTRFLLAEEMPVHEDYRRRLIAAAETDPQWYPNLYDVGLPDVPTACCATQRPTRGRPRAAPQWPAARTGRRDRALRLRGSNSPLRASATDGRDHRGDRSALDVGRTGRRAGEAATASGGHREGAHLPPVTRDGGARTAAADAFVPASNRHADWPGRRSAIHAESDGQPMAKEMPACRARPCRTRSTLSGTAGRPVPRGPATLEERRATFVPGDRLHPVPDDVRVTEVTAGGVPAHWLTAPGADTGRVLLFLHGGGYELGLVPATASWPPGWDGPAGCGCCSLNTGWPPSIPSPPLSTTSWPLALAPTGQDLGEPSLAVAGDSAGGGLATALLVALRDAGQALPAAAALMSPTVDLTSSGASMTERADQDPISTPAMLGQFAAGYLAGADPKTPLASPLFASLAGLPPLLIQVGTADLLLSDSERLAAAADQPGSTSPCRPARDCPRLPAPARHPRGSPGHRAVREIPASPGPLTSKFGDDPCRYASAKARRNYAGASPITRASGKKKSSKPGTYATTGSPAR